MPPFCLRSTPALSAARRIRTQGQFARKYRAYRASEGVCERTLFVLDRQGTIASSYCSPIAVNPGTAGILARIACCASLSSTTSSVIFWNMHDALFANRSRLSIPAIFLIGEELRLPETAMRYASETGQFRNASSETRCATISWAASAAAE
jgi:hypothetical protein